MDISFGNKFSADLFKTPTSDFGVTYMWLWNVPISRELIDRELCEYKKAGVQSLYIVPLPKDFRPEDIRTYMDPEYLTDEFFDLVEYALKSALELGMTPWLYDEGGWPSGGACGKTFRENPNAKLKIIERREVSLMCDKRFYPEEGFIALFDGKRRLPDDYIPSRDVILTAYYFIEVAYNLSRVDYTNASVTETFINNTYEAYRKRLGDLFGKDIPIIFTDEPGLMRGSLADREFDLFLERFGYDLRDYAYVIYDIDLCNTDEEIKARIDHGILLGELFKKNTFELISSWCENAGIYYSGHLDIDNRPFGGMSKGTFSMVDSLRNFQVPGVDLIWEQIRYPYGGRAPVDDETLGFGFFPRLAPSAARQMGRNVSVTESLGVFGDGLIHDEIRYVTNYQIMRGINAVNYGSICIGGTRIASLVIRPNFRPEKPGFYNLREINEYYSRLCYLARLGHPEGDTAIYMPCRDYWADSSAADRANVTFKEVGTSLEERNIPFDIIDDAGILAAKDTGDGLLLGDALYRHIAVPENRYMPEEVKAKIAPYLGEGKAEFDFKSNKLRYMTRRLDEGRLIFIFNEGEPTVTEKLELGKAKNVYRLDPRSGSIFSAQDPICTLSCGDVAVYLLTNKEYATEPQEIEYSSEVKILDPIAHRRFIIEYEGLKNEYGDGKIDIDESFSGEITYRAEYTLPKAPQAGESYRISLDGFSASVCLTLGDRQIPLGMTPMVTTVDGGLLESSGEMKVAVSNTAKNEIYAKMDLINMHPKAEIGLYQDRLDVTEVRTAPLKVGSIRIEKLCD